MKRICLILALLAAGTLLCAETVFTVAPTATLSNADIREYVYLYPSYHKLSELDWDAHNVFQYGVKAEISYNRFLASADFAVAQQGECGLMQDYDWFFADPSTPNPSGYPVTKLTHKSEHPVTLLEKNRLDIKAGWNVYSSGKVSFALGGGFQFLRTKLEGHDGYCQYPSGEQVTPWSASRPKVRMPDGPGIDYQLDIESLWLDVRLAFVPARNFELIVEGGISPWQEIHQDDWHLLRGIWFYDKPDSSIMFRASLSGTYSFTRRSSIVLSGSVESLPYSDGNAYQHTSATEIIQYSGQLGGTGYFGWDVSLSYRIRIF